MRATMNVSTVPSAPRSTYKARLAKARDEYAKNQLSQWEYLESGMGKTVSHISYPSHESEHEYCKCVTNKIDR